MLKEIVNVIEIMDSGELLLALEGGGDSSYQFIYRAAAGVCWDETQKGFRTSEVPKEWNYADWCIRIVAAVKSELGVELRFSSEIKWVNVPQKSQRPPLEVEV